MKDGKLLIAHTPIDKHYPIPNEYQNITISQLPLYFSIVSAHLSRHRSADCRRQTLVLARLLHGVPVVQPLGAGQVVGPGAPLQHGRQRGPVGGLGGAQSTGVVWKKIKLALGGLHMWLVKGYFRRVLRCIDKHRILQHKEYCSTKVKSDFAFQTVSKISRCILCDKLTFPGRLVGSRL